MAAEPDPVALLRGVEESREAIRSGKIEMSWHGRQLVPRSPEGNGASLTVHFDGYKRTYWQRMRVLVMPPSTPHEERAKLQKVESFATYEEAARAGLGRIEEKLITSAWDGANLCQHGEGFWTGFRSHTGGSLEHLADPRLFGVGEGDEGVFVTLEKILPHKTAKDIKLMGTETIAGKTAYHVSLVPHPDVEYHYWIEDSTNFRVHRFEYRASFRTTISVSEFHGQGVLPRRVTRQVFNPKKEPIREATLEIVKAELNVPVEPTVGTIASLSIPPGNPVDDERINRRIGFWDGEQVVDNQDAAIQHDRQRQATIARRRAWRWGVLGASVALAIGIVVAGWRIRRSRVRPMVPT